MRWLLNTIGSWPGSTPAKAQAQAWSALNTGRLYVPTPVKNKPGQYTWSWQTIPTVGDTGLLNIAYNSVRPGSNGLTPGDVSYLHSMGFTIGNKMPIAPAQTVKNAVGAITPGLSGLF